jgi:hypothetical protein
LSVRCLDCRPLRCLFILCTSCSLFNLPDRNSSFFCKQVNASDSRGKADSNIEKGVRGSTSNSVKELISNATLSYSDNRLVF